MRTQLLSLIIGMIFAGISLAKTASAQSTEEQFQDIFITAGYAAAFGASLGAASLAFHNYPEDHLKDVAIGASLGFIGGSMFGTYIVLSPVVMQPENNNQNLLSATRPKAGSSMTLMPMFNKKTSDLTGLGAGFNFSFN